MLRVSTDFIVLTFKNIHLVRLSLLRNIAILANGFFFT